jgi:hypothetical protein
MSEVKAARFDPKCRWLNNPDQSSPGEAFFNFRYLRFDHIPLCCERNEEGHIPQPSQPFSAESHAFDRDRYMIADV